MRYMPPIRENWVHTHVLAYLSSSPLVIVANM